MTNEAWRLDDNGELDDVVVPHVETFRMERMGKNQWWIGLYLNDGRMVHVDLFHQRQCGIVATKRED